MTWKQFYLFCFVAGLLATMASADTEIITCQNITADGRFFLTQDINDTPADNRYTCISIQHSDVVLDCQGNTIQSNPPPMDGVIHVSDVNNVSIEDCVLPGHQTDPVVVNSEIGPYATNFGDDNYYGDYLITANGGGGYRIFNATSPADFAQLAVVTTMNQTGDNIVAIDYIGSDIIVATGRCNVSTFNVSDPFNPVLLDTLLYPGGWPIPGAVWQPPNCCQIKGWVSEDLNELYTIACMNSGPATAFIKYDISNPNAISLDSSAYGMSLTDIRVDRLEHHSTPTNELVLVEDSVGNLHLINVTPTVPTAVHTYNWYTPHTPPVIPAWSMAIRVDENDILYMDNTRWLYIYDISPMYSGLDPTFISMTYIYSGSVTSGGGDYMWKDQDLLFMQNIRYDLSIYDVSNLYRPEFIWGTYPTGVGSEAGFYKFNGHVNHVMSSQYDGTRNARIWNHENTTLAAAILLEGADDVVIDGNTITGSHQYGIRAIGNTSNIINYNITDNTVNITKPLSWALRAESGFCPTGWSVSGNIFISPYSMLSGALPCPGNVFNITPSSGGNYYGNCTDLDNNSVCDNGYIEETNVLVTVTHNDTLNSTWVDSAPYSVPGCTPDYYCSNFLACEQDNTKDCDEVNDHNNCGIAYPGLDSDFDASCTYSSGGGGGFPEEPPPLLSLLPPLEETIPFIKQFEEFWLLIQNIYSEGITQEKLKALFSGWNLVILAGGILAIGVLVRQTTKKKPKKRRRKR